MRTHSHCSLLYRSSVLFCAVLTWVSGGEAKAETLRVRAAPHFAQVHATSSRDGLELVGRLVDEVSTPLAGLFVTAKAGAVRLQTCTSSSGTTDQAGAFCFSLPEGLEAANSLSVNFSGNEFFEPASGIASRLGAFALELDLGLPQATYVLGTSPADAAITLRRPTPQEADPNTDFLAVSLHVETSVGPPLALPRLQVRSGETHTFSLEALATCPPGKAQLVARLEAPGGDPVEAVRGFRIVSPVVLSWRALPTAVEQGVELRLSVAVAATGGPLDTGWVELNAGDRSVALSPVIAGHAELVAEVGSLGAPSITVKARYLPASPDYLAAGDLEATFNVQPPPVWRHLPWMLIACASVWWITRGWRRPTRRTPPGSTPDAHLHDPIEVVRGNTTVSSGWVGFVRDAHTAAPIYRATLEILVPSLGSKSVLEFAESDGAGAFRLAAAPALPEGARMSVSAEGYSTELARVPATGEIVVRLTARRRKLLEALVLWTEARGRPWAKTPEATPRDVIRTAELQGEAEAKLWAAGVEDSVFGAVPPSPQDEAELLARRPR